MTRSRLSSLTVLSFAVAAFMAPVAVANGPLLRLRAFAVNLSGPAPVRTGTLDITIERWSTPAEAAKLRDPLINTLSPTRGDFLPIRAFGHTVFR